MTKAKHIRAAESRINVIQQLIVDGEDAEAVYKYAYTMKKEADEAMLKAALLHDDIEQQRSDYRAVCKLVDMLQHAAFVGKQKKKILGQS